MEWIQVFTIIFSIGGIIYWFKGDLERDINRLDSDIKVQNQKFETQNQRIDQLYTMFIDLLKERKNP